MNKFLLLILLISSSVTFADTISCPTSDASVSGTPWKIFLQIWEIPDSCTGIPSEDASINGRCEQRGTYYLYNLTTKKLDNRLAIFDSMQYSYNNAYISSHSNSMAKTLVCEGNYEGKSTTRFLGYNWSDTKNGLMRAELTLSTEYTSCTPALNKNDQSFECNK